MDDKDFAKLANLLGATRTVVPDKPANDENVTASRLEDRSPALRAPVIVRYGGHPMTSTSSPRHRFDVPEVSALGSNIDCNEPRGLSAAEEASSEGVTSESDTPAEAAP